MSRPLALPTELAPDWRSLQALLDTHHWQAIPCRSGQVVPVAWWTSDQPSESELAAQACAPCPAIAQCRAYGLKHRKEAGVLGGLTETERKP